MNCLTSTLDGAFNAVTFSSEAPRPPPPPGPVCLSLLHATPPRGTRHAGRPGRVRARAAGSAP